MSRRQELERTLPPPSEAAIRHVNQLCIQGGVSTSLSPADYMFIHRAFIDYLKNSADGKRTMLKHLNATVKQASYEKKYYPDGYYGVPEKEMDHRHLVEYSGWIYKGIAGAHDKIEVAEVANLVECEQCHGRYPKNDCAVDSKIYSGGREHITTVCNYCRMNSDDLRLRQSASGKTCYECKFTVCAYHPSKQRSHNLSQPPLVGEVRRIEYQPQPVSPPDLAAFSMI
jgi:hypothetical protein